MEGFNKFLERISNQSTLIVLIAFGYSYFALKGQDNFLSPMAVTGFISFGIGVFLLLGNFFVNQISEGYRYVIDELKGVINTLRSQNRFTEKHYRDKLSTSTSESAPKTLEKSGYTIQQHSESTTTE